MNIIIVTCREYQDVLRLTLERLKDYGFFSSGDVSLCIASDGAPDTGLLSLIDASCLKVVIHDSWVGRLIEALKVFRSRRCLVLLDDYTPEGAPDLAEIRRLILDEHQYDAVYLAPVLDSVGFAPSELGACYADVPRNTLYRVNSTVGVWNVASLRSLLVGFDEPWSWEAFCGLTVQGQNAKVATVVRQTVPPYPYSYSTGGLVYRGAWVATALSALNVDEDWLRRFSTRPVIAQVGISARTLSWKLNFLKTGFDAVGLRVFLFGYHSLKKKWRDR